MVHKSFAELEGREPSRNPSSIGGSGCQPAFLFLYQTRIFQQEQVKREKPGGSLLPL